VSEGNQPKIKIESIDDVLAILDEVDKFLKKYRLAEIKLRSVASKFVREERRSRFYSMKDVERWVSDLIQRELEKRLSIKPEETEIEEEELEKEAEREAEELTKKLLEGKKEEQNVS